jgi:dienelactone hydrolase
LVYRPDSADKFPLISWSHAFARGGEYHVDRMSGRFMLTDLASAGYVVLAHLSGEHWYCDEDEDQIRTIEWATTDVYMEPKIDWTIPVGVAGYSMGGAAAVMTAANQ